MTGQPVRLASEDVIVAAPMSYSGSARRIMRLRRRTSSPAASAAIAFAAVLLILFAWTVVTAWYLAWGTMLRPYRRHRRKTRERKIEALRHRELVEAVQGEPRR